MSNCEVKCRRSVKIECPTLVRTRTEDADGRGRWQGEAVGTLGVRLGDAVGTLGVCLERLAWDMAGGGGGQ